MSERPAASYVPSALPETLPVFALEGAILLPQARLPLNIYEPRYLALVEDALGKGRMIGIVQPNGTDEDKSVPPLYSVGCAGRIVSFSETEDGRLMIVLAGVCRFRIDAELPTTRLYRAVRADWTPYLDDLQTEETEPANMEVLTGLLKTYFKKHGVVVDWSVVANTPANLFLSTIIMISPLAPNEKQALLEAPTPQKRAEMLQTLLEMALVPDMETDLRH